MRRCPCMVVVVELVDRGLGHASCANCNERICLFAWEVESAILCRHFPINGCDCSNCLLLEVREEQEQSHLHQHEARTKHVVRSKMWNLCILLCSTSQTLLGSRKFKKFLIADFLEFVSVASTDKKKEQGKKSVNSFGNLKPHQLLK
jgi:hypothetical protein